MKSASPLYVATFPGVSPSKLKGTHDKTNHQVTEAEVAFPIKRH